MMLTPAFFNVTLRFLTSSTGTIKNDSNPTPRSTPASQWTANEAWEWFDRQGFQQGANFLPSTAANQFEMFGNDNGLDEATIERELRWAADLGYTAMRVFLHNDLYTENADAFLDRVDRYLALSTDCCNIQTVLVLFDGCWDPVVRHPTEHANGHHHHHQYRPSDSRNHTVLAASRATQQVTTDTPFPSLPIRPHVHNSRWVQAPGKDILVNTSAHDELLRPYIQSVVRRFGKDDRVLMLDLFNEPDAPNHGSYGTDGPRVASAQDAYGTELDLTVKYDALQKLIPAVFQWARDIGPITVPLTIGQFGHEQMPTEPLHEWYVQQSDVISFHNYDPFPIMAKEVDDLLQRYGRPVVCTEYMARTVNSTFDPILGFLYQKRVWAFNWGLVAGRMQTQYPWDSWSLEYDDEPSLWHHDVLRPNGTVYSESEKDYLLSYRTSVVQDVKYPYPHVAWDVSVAVLCVLWLMAIVLVKASRYRERQGHPYWLQRWQRLPTEAPQDMLATRAPFRMD